MEWKNWVGDHTPLVVFVTGLPWRTPPTSRLPYSWTQNSASPSSSPSTPPQSNWRSWTSQTTTTTCTNSWKKCEVMMMWRLLADYLSVMAKHFCARVEKQNPSRINKKSWSNISHFSFSFEHCYAMFSLPRHSITIAAVWLKKIFFGIEISHWNRLWPNTIGEILFNPGFFCNTTWYLRCGKCLPDLEFFAWVLSFFFSLLFSPQFFLNFLNKSNIFGKN